jgi:hypothetical protein
LTPPTPKGRGKGPKILLAAGVGTLVVVVSFLLAWMLISSSDQTSSYVREALQHMNEITGWEGEVKVDNSGIGVDPMTLSLFGNWRGDLAFQSPDRFSLDAVTVDGSTSYSLRIISGKAYEWNSIERYWTDLGPAPPSYLTVNPPWNPAFNERLSFHEEEGLEEVEGVLCKAYTFDQEVTMREETLLGETDVPYRYKGTVYVDQSTRLVRRIDYVVELEGFGRTHYQYAFRSLDQPVKVEEPSLP